MTPQFRCLAKTSSHADSDRRPIKELSNSLEKPVARSVSKGEAQEGERDRCETRRAFRSRPWSVTVEKSGLSATDVATSAEVRQRSVAICVEKSLCSNHLRELMTRRGCWRVQDRSQVQDAGQMQRAILLNSVTLKAPRSRLFDPGCAKRNATEANGDSHISRGSRVVLSRSTSTTTSHAASALMRDMRCPGLAPAP